MWTFMMCWLTISLYWLIAHYVFHVDNHLQIFIVSDILSSLQVTIAPICYMLIAINLIFMLYDYTGETGLKENVWKVVLTTNTARRI